MGHGTHSSNGGSGGGGSGGGSGGSGGNSSGGGGGGSSRSGSGSSRARSTHWAALVINRLDRVEVRLNAEYVVERYVEDSQYTDDLGGETQYSPSASAPVFGGAAAAAACAVLQVSLAVWSALHLFVSVSQMNWVMMPMACSRNTSLKISRVRVVRVQIPAQTRGHTTSCRPAGTMSPYGCRSPHQLQDGISNCFASREPSSDLHSILGTEQMPKSPIALEEAAEVAAAAALVVAETVAVWPAPEVTVTVTAVGQSAAAVVDAAAEDAVSTAAEVAMATLLVTEDAAAGVAAVVEFEQNGCVLRCAPGLTLAFVAGSKNGELSFAESAG